MNRSPLAEPATIAADDGRPSVVIGVLPDGPGIAAQFAVELTWRQSTATAGRGWDVALDVTFTGTGAVDAGLVVRLPLGSTATPRWLIPGLFYGENRPAGSTRIFPRYALGEKDEARFVSDTWSFRSDRAATPVVFGWDGSRSAALSTNERSAVGDTGLGFTGRASQPEIRLFFPYREEPVVYDGSETPRAAEVALHRWAPGERVRLTFAVHVGGAQPHSYAPVLRDLHAALAPDSRLQPWVSVERAAQLAAEGLLRWHYSEGDGVLLETAAFERDGAAPGEAPGDRRAMHVAWLSGTPHAYALLAHGRRVGDAAAVRAGGRVLDEIAANLAPCGTFWGQWSAKRGWGKGWTPGRDRLHARTLAEATLFMARAVGLETGAGVERPEWRAAVASNLDFVMARQRDDGALGSAYDGRTGVVEAWHGAAGMAWITALVEGAELLSRPELRDVARRAGDYYARFVADEFINGAPEDVDLAPTSEDGYVAVMACVALLEAAVDKADAARWLDLARRAADWMLTFRYAYNVSFQSTTLLGAYRYATRGGDQASVANQHIHAYGLICLPEMVRLAAHTGDSHYLERTRENLACFRQFIARDDGDFNARRGMAPERYFQSACFGPKGTVGALSHAWCLGLLLYACDEAALTPQLGGDELT